MKIFAPFVIALCLTLMVWTGAMSQQDIDPPTLVDIQFTPTTIDTSRAAQTITVTAHITDDLSGFGGGYAMFSSESTAQYAVVQFREQFQIDDGRYQATIELPRYAAYGSWRMTFVRLLDRVGNGADHHYPGDKENISAEVWPAHFNTFTFTNGSTQPEQTERLFIPFVTAR